MRREGSALQGLGVVTLKELSDHLTSARMRVLEWLVVLTALAAVFGAIQQIRAVTAEDPFLFLRLFTTAREPLPSFVAFLGFLVPLMAIGLGFDAVNGEHNRRTLSRILSQPIYRDALLFGKFLAGLGVIAISLVCLWLLGDRARPDHAGRAAGRRGDGARADLPPGDHRLCRRLAGAGHAVLGDLPLGRHRGAGDARPLAVPLGDLAGAGTGDRQAFVSPEHQATYVVTAQMLARLSPSTLFGEVVLALLDPTTRTLGPVYLSQLEGAVMGAPVAAVGQRDGGLAADRRHGGRQHPLVRRRLYRVPKARGEGVA